MDENFDELGNYVGSPEYSDSDAGDQGDQGDWEDVTDPTEDNAIVKSLYGPNVEIAHYKHDAQDAKEPLVPQETYISVTKTIPKNWEFHKGLMNTSRSLQRNIAVVGHVNQGKSSFVELFTGIGTTDTNHLEIQRNLTLSLSCHTSLVHDSTGKSYVLNLVDTPGHIDFDDEVQASRILANNEVLVVDAVEGPVLSRFKSASVIIVNKIDRLILDLRLPPSKAFDRLRYLIEDELAVDPDRVVFMSTKFRFAFTLHSFAQIYTSYQDAEGDLHLWNATNFISFVLDPLYKLFSYGLIGCRSQEALASLDITLTKSDWQLSYDDRIRLILSQFFEDPEFTAVVDVLIKYCHPPKEYKNTNSQITVAKKVRVGSEVLSLVRVNHGYLNRHTSQPLFVPFGSSVVETEAIYTGNWAFIVTPQKPEAVNTIPLVKIGIEPIRDSISVSEQMTRGLETLSELHPALKVRIMETGEYCLWGTGELYMDCVIEELKTLTNCEIHVGPPSSQLLETVSEHSYVACPTKTPSAETSVAIIAAPLCTDVINEVEKANDAKEGLPRRDYILPEGYSVWTTYNGNILSDNSVPPLLDQVNQTIKNSLIQGFEWACDEGPLMEQPLRGVHFNIMEGKFDSTIQLIPTMRRACHAAMLVASPRIMEPWMRTTVIGNLVAGKAVYSELAKRRGKVESDKAVLGTNIYSIQGVIPLMDAFGFEIDVLCNLSQRNEAQVSLEFYDWRIVDGDPLDTSLAAARLKPASGGTLARDYMLKTRRRTGLVAEVNLERYLDEDVAATILSH